jgi:hypothetical protein
MKDRHATQRQERQLIKKGIASIGHNRGLRATYVSYPVTIIPAKTIVRRSELSVDATG